MMSLCMYSYKYCQEISNYLATTDHFPWNRKGKFICLHITSSFILRWHLMFGNWHGRTSWNWKKCLSSLLKKKKITDRAKYTSFLLYLFFFLSSYVSLPCWLSIAKVVTFRNVLYVLICLMLFHWKQYFISAILHLSINSGGFSHHHLLSNFFFWPPSITNRSILAAALQS